MKVLNKTAFLYLFLFTGLIVITILPVRSQPSMSTQSEPLWTHWQGQQYALAQDGDHLWLATASGIVRYEIATGAIERWGNPEGIPHRHVFDVAVAPNGDVWFGGDAGITRYRDGEWLHLNSRNSGLQSDLVDDVAISAEHIYFAHGLPDGKVSRLSDGLTWTHFADRKAAILSDYTTILQTINPNDTDLWTIRGDEVWIGYDAYNGSSWQTNIPPYFNLDVLDQVVDSQNNLWSLAKYSIYMWDGTQWAYYGQSTPFSLTNSTIAISASDIIWVGYQSGKNGPYEAECLSLAAFDVQQGDFTYQDIDACYKAPRDLIVIDEDIWGVGDGYLLDPEVSILNLNSPEHQNIEHVTLVNDELVVNAYTVEAYFISGFSTVDDDTTQMLADDSWQVEYDPFFYHLVLDSQAVNGVTWARALVSDRAPYERLGQFVDGSYHSVPSGGQLSDFYPISERVVWTLHHLNGVQKRDTMGTLELHTDDIVTDYPLPHQITNGALAVTPDETIYVGDDSGLYMLEDSDLTPIYSAGVSDITLLADGTVVARPISNAFTSVIVSPPGGLGEVVPITEFVQENLAELVASTVDNDIWKVRGDAIWYLTEHQIHRAAADGVISADLPFGLATNVSSWVVDINGQAWVTARDALWRLNLSPDFALSGTEKVLLDADQARSATFVTSAILGFDGDVALEIVGALPDGIVVDGLLGSAEINEPIQVTITADPSVTNGYYPITLRASSGALTHDHTFSIVVVDQLYESSLPIISK